MPPMAEDCCGRVTGLFILGQDGAFVPFDGIREATVTDDGSNPFVCVPSWTEPEEIEFSLTRQGEKNLRKLIRPHMNRRRRMIRRFLRRKEKLRRDRLKGKLKREDVFVYENH